MRTCSIESLAALALLAASDAISEGEKLPPLKTRPETPKRQKSDSLKRLLRKAKS